MIRYLEVIGIQKQIDKIDQITELFNVEVEILNKQTFNILGNNKDYYRLKIEANSKEMKLFLDALKNHSNTAYNTLQNNKI